MQNQDKSTIQTTNDTNTTTNTPSKTESKIDSSTTFDPELSTDASLQLQTLFGMSSKFEQTKLYLNRVGNYYINSLFSFLGYQYKGKVENANILHISAEAWLLGVFGELKREEESNEKNVKLSYYNLISQIKQTIVPENKFIDNMKLLTGIYGLDEVSLGDSRIFKMFLVNIQATKNEMACDNEKMTKKDFESLLQTTLRVAFNYTLNEFNSSEDDKKSLDLVNTYLDVESKKEVNPYTLEQFINSYVELKKIKLDTLPPVEERKLILHLTYFYNFCQTSFSELLQEINLFNNNAGSVVFKIKNLLSIRNIKRMSIKYFDMITHTLEYGLKNLKLESVSNFVKSVVNDKIKPLPEKTLALVKNNFNKSKNWLSSTIKKYEIVLDPYTKNFKEYSKIVYESTLKYSEVPRVFLEEKVFQPAKHFTIKITNTSYTFVIDTLHLGKEKSLALKNYIKNKVESGVESAKLKYTTIKNNILGEDPLVKVDYETRDKEYMRISISKRLFIIDPTRAGELLKNIVDQIRLFSLKETVITSVTYTKSKVNGARDYVVNSYRKFLELACEEENESEDGEKITHIKSA